MYPVPQKVTDSEETVQLTDTIHVIKEEGIDTVTQNRIEEVLTEHGYAVEYSNIAVEGEMDPEELRIHTMEFPRMFLQKAKINMICTWLRSIKMGIS